jgi:hypothetical protein
LSKFALQFFGECFDYFPAVFCPLFAVLFFLDNPFPDKPIGFDHCGVNCGVGFVSGGDDDLFDVGNIKGLSHSCILCCDSLFFFWGLISIRVYCMGASFFMLITDHHNKKSNWGLFQFQPYVLALNLSAQLSGQHNQNL